MPTGRAGVARARWKPPDYETAVGGYVGDD